MSQSIEKIWRFAKIIKNIREHGKGEVEGKAPGGGGGKTLCAEFHITVYEEGDYDRVTVEVQSSDAIMIDGISACAYFMALIANRAGPTFEEALSMLCGEAREYETKVIAMPRRE